MSTAALKTRGASTARSVSEHFSDFIARVSFDSLPPRVIEIAKTRVLDSLATALPSRDLEVPVVARRFVEAQGSTGPSTIIGAPVRVAPADAAFVNATLINARSQDDFLLKSHPGALTLSAALAIGELQRSGGAELLAALVIGYELVGRVYLGGPGMLPQFRSSGVVGTVAAAGVGAKLLKLDTPQTINALGLAACFSHGFGEGFLSGTTDVKLNVGMACRSGVTAALLAQHGATASAQAFEGEVGLYRAVARSTEHIGEATRGLGERFLIEDTVYKECPVCMLLQTPVVLARGLGARLDPGAIAKVVVRAPELTYTNPGFTNVAPYTTHLQAVVSARFCIAAAVLGRPVESYAFYDELRDPGVLALAEKVELEMRPELANRVEIEVVLASGEILKEAGQELETLQPTTEKILAKFRRIAPRPGVDVERIVEKVMRLEQLENVAALATLLRG